MDIVRKKLSLPFLGIKGLILFWNLIVPSDSKTLNLLLSINNVLAWPLPSYLGGGMEVEGKAAKVLTNNFI